MLDTKLETQTGSAYCEGAEIVLVSAPFRAMGKPTTFAVGLRSGHTIHALENKSNLESLRPWAAHGFIQAVPRELAAPPPTPAPARGRGRPRKTDAAKTDRDRVIDEAGLTDDERAKVRAVLEKAPGAGGPTR